MIARLFALSAVLLLAGSLTTGAGASPTAAESGEDGVTAVNVTVAQVYARYVDDRPDHIVVDDTRTFDLLELSDSISAVMADSDPPAGVVDHLRLLVTDGHIIVDGVQHPLTLPSADRAGLKLQGPFSVQPDCTPVLTADVDVAESIIHNQGRGWIFKPVIDILETAQACDDDDEETLLTLPGFQGAWEADSDAMSIYSDQDRPAYWFETNRTFDAISTSRDGLGARYVDNAIYGQPAVRFTAADEQRFVRDAASGLPQTATDGHTIYAVARYSETGTDTRQTLVSQWNWVNGRLQQYEVTIVNPGPLGELHYRVRSDFGVATVVSDTIFEPDQWALITARFKDGNLYLRVNGVLVRQETLPGTIRLPDENSFFAIGALAPDRQFWNGDVASIYLYNEGHDDATVADVEAQLMHKFDLTS